ncbi:hypothetical protein Cgig2_032175 [Carnegiea gigantea]|uniref:Pectinesterase inhibitor domain-containing protein n=1 Tax=Carnegiea gigantea TaxID=171969 RepID=A0A9Q1GJZ2_9CARY|nr:hypothetical protein Cgig2_000310 [Carnegiea gigantea]KAJ8422542.1 hypothetical protein Cgig2_032175 [Carnegiea gigantea]
MDSPKNLVLCMVLFVIISSSATPTSADLIEDMCKKVPLYSQLCVSILQSDRRSVHVSDAKVLAGIVAEQALAKAKETTVAINKLFQSTTEGWLKSDLTACPGMYKAAVSEHLPKAINSIQVNNISQAINLLTAASNDASDCEDVFEGAPGVSPIKDRNDAMSQLCIISY